MAHALSLVYGATTISLSTGNNLLIDYTPRTPGSADLEVTESAEVHITAASKTALQTAIRAIEDYFILCQRRQATGTGDKGYVRLAVDGDGTTWRSEILDGRLVLDEEALPYWGNVSAKVLLTWTRRFFWEGDQESIGLKRTGVSKTTSGVTIYNHHDSTTHENLIDIEGADIEGSLPSPLKISLEATAALNTRRFYLSANTFHTPASWQAVYEGEDSTGAGTPTVDANSSDGYYMARTWTPSIAHTTNAFIWSISATQLGYAAGGWFRVLMRLASSAPSNCYVKLRVMFDATTPLTTLWEGPEILLNTSRQLQDLGSVQLPPGYVTGSPTALALVLSLRCAVTGQLDVDYLQLCGPDGVHRFNQQGYQLEIGDLVVDDGPNEGVYIQTYGGFTQHIFSDFPPPLLVWPGRDMRIRLLFDNAYGNSVIANTFTVYAQYRPRRLTV
ncbi:MAG: hypothetical protein KF753_04970 [Caldilineaceae bacterium]|nr:hypothetical protein [Caldilineaceae bacterium]